MNDLHNRFQAVDQLAITLSIVFKLTRLFFEQLKDVVGRVAGLKLVSERVVSRIYSDLQGVVGESCIEDALK